MPRKPVVLLLGPSREAISGVTTHVNLLLGSSLNEQFDLLHFQVGSEGRRETLFGRALRLACSPFVLAATILSRRAGVVHINTTRDFRGYWRDLLYLVVAKVCGARVVYQVHGGKLPEDFFRRGRLMARALRMTLEWPDAVVVLGNEEAEAHREFHPGQKVVALPNGIDCTPFRRLRRPPLGRDAPLSLIYIGRLIRQKGLFEALEAMERARRRGIATRLTLVGSGPEEQALRALVERLHLSREVVFAGEAWGERKVELLGEADVLLLPSYEEGLPYALLEAMAAGAVPVATRVGAVPDVMHDGVHGLFVPMREVEPLVHAIAVLAGDRRRLARMSEACRARVASAYSIERLAAEVAELYEGLSTPTGASHVRHRGLDRSA